MVESHVDLTAWEPVSDSQLAPLHPMPLTWSVLAPVLEAAYRKTADEMKDVMKTDLPAGALWQLVAGQAYRRREIAVVVSDCLLYTSPSPRDRTRSRMPSSA